ncbi:ribosome-associated protein [Sulfuritortus calidifontis]|uniref:Ribosomal silencing factor RsfS n=1 Tax=Sulfuritortus calidifontis TaxID=1914471 RepID=A0A4R3K077_9PROT|nr:ribosome silencing factor [Sulfuritortus calidifontis]TCS73261.1 ribosome-associated protein [Sulfuritortus calidifontis]
MDIEQIVKIAVAALEDIKGKDITVMDVAHLSPLFERMIIASGDSNRQVKALADNVRDKLKEAGIDILGTEGESGDDWVLVDAGSVIVHVMHPTVRAYYNLEELWGAAQKARNAAA